MQRIPRLGLALVVLALTGCKGHRQSSASYTIAVLKPAKIDWNAPLPPDDCYVASRNYEVEISSRSELLHSLCDQVAATYLRHEPRLRWPPPYLRKPDRTPSVVCVLAQGPDRIEIDYGPANTGRLDAEAICDALRAAGWKRRPPYEGLDGPWPASD